MNQARSRLGAAGTTMAAISVGGNTGSRVTTTEEYNGISWSGGGNLSEAKDDVACAGTQAAGLCSGGG